MSRQVEDAWGATRFHGALQGVLLLQRFRVQQSGNRPPLLVGTHKPDKTRAAMPIPRLACSCSRDRRYRGGGIRREIVVRVGDDEWCGRLPGRRIPVTKQVPS